MDNENDDTSLFFGSFESEAYLDHIFLPSKDDSPPKRDEETKLSSKNTGMAFSIFLTDKVDTGDSDSTSTKRRKVVSEQKQIEPLRTLSNE